jgi:hypothetical protein
MHAVDALKHVADLQCKASAAGVTINSTLDVLVQGVAELPECERWRDLLQFLQITLANRQADTDEALRVLRAAVTEQRGRGPVAASAHTSSAHGPAAPFPHYMADLVDRAAMLLQVHGLGAVVSFSWWADGEDHAYTARLVWQSGSAELAPRVMVFRGRSGDFVCQSLVGNYFDVDPSTWAIDVPSDEIDREIWEQAQRQPARAAR